MTGRGKPATRAQPLLAPKKILEPMEWVTEAVDNQSFATIVINFFLFVLPRELLLW